MGPKRYKDATSLLQEAGLPKPVNGRVVEAVGRFIDDGPAEFEGVMTGYVCKDGLLDLSIAISPQLVISLVFDAREETWSGQFPDGRGDVHHIKLRLL